MLTWDPNLTKIYTASTTTSRSVLQLKEPTLTKLMHWIAHSTPEAYVSKLQQQGIHVLQINDPLYPSLLAEIYDPPVLLYGKGNLQLLATKKVALVGSRSPTSYGTHAVESLTKVLTESKVTIVSGMARGIDSHAHRFAIKAGGSTIAVTASGFEHPYPSESKIFMEKTPPTALLTITEYPPHVKPQKWHFPMRNRIISGLSYATIVIEAKQKSGSLITADCALEHGRHVFALPGSIYSLESEGANWLISQGAYCLYHERALFECMPSFMSNSIEEQRFC
ncbi:DNA-processing protein DprA [Shouchella sp. 1P09AA]|uniref:DNA-processing protein DprA n=1 Tax=unclassified Shouchella TaxID=2893065 RepID=UPI00399FDE8F